METAEIVVIAINGSIGLFILIAIVFLIVKRVKDKKEETFEKRDN